MHHVIGYGRKRWKRQCLIMGSPRSGVGQYAAIST
jgi:hypothetical protein